MLSLLRVWFQLLVWELRFFKPCGLAKRKKKNAYRRLTQNQEQTDPHEELHQASIKISLKKEERKGGGWGGGRRGRETEKGRGKEKKSKNRSRVQKAFILKYRITNSF